MLPFEMRRVAAMAACFAVAAVCTAADASVTRNARCFTTDTGAYDCAFIPGPQGSFTITAPGKPTIMLNMDEPGVASGFAEIGGRNVALPGRYHRNAAEPACWENDATRTRVCAWGRR